MIGRMSPTRAEQAESTRRAVVDTARKLFLQNGFDATSLQSIADAMGVTKANVYYYYRTKIEILEAVLQPVLDVQAARLETARGIADAAARRDYLITSWVDEVVTAYRTVAPMSRSDPIMLRHHGIRDELDDLFGQGLHLMFGATPTVDQQAAFWFISDLGVVLRRLDELSDDTLRVTLTRLCRQVVDGALDG
jgi:AcrR family transcriptional regulator